MSRRLRVVLSVIGAGLLLSGAAATWAVRKPQLAFEESQQNLAADWEKYQARVHADEARWKDDALLGAHEGGDGAAVLFAHVRWEGAATPRPPALDVLQSLGDAWVSHSKDFNLSSLDLSWMAQLPTFGYWDIEGDGSQLRGKPFAPLGEALPNFGDLQLYAKARLLKGLADGSPRQAAADVRELARLSLSTETLVGALVGAALLGNELKAYEEARRRGLDVTGWTPVSEPDKTALKRALMVAQAPGSLLATTPLSAMKLPVGQCAALRENLGIAWYLKGHLEAVLPARYQALGRALEASPCRLSRARAAWTGTDTAGQLRAQADTRCLAGADRPAWCWLPRPLVRRVMNRSIGATLVVISGHDWFSLYRP